MRVFSINLYRTSSLDPADGYCGCWHIPVPEAEADELRERLHPLGFGLARDSDGTITRSWFFAEELDAQVLAAAQRSECYTDVVDVTERGAS